MLLLAGVDSCRGAGRRKELTRLRLLFLSLCSVNEGSMRSLLYDVSAYVYVSDEACKFMSRTACSCMQGLTEPTRRAPLP